MAALQFVDRYSSTLASGYTSGGTSLVVSSATNLPADGACNFYLIVKADGVNTEEVFHVTNKSGTTLTVVGGQANTSASNHGSGAVVIGTTMTVNAFSQYKTDVINGSGLVQLAQVVTSGSQATVTFSSISAAFSNLRIVYMARGDSAASIVELHMECNSDTTSGHYDTSQYILGNGASVSAGTAGASAIGSWIDNIPAATASSNYGGNGVISIPAYALTTFVKVWTCEGRYAQSGTNHIKVQSCGAFNQTSAISAIAFALSAGNFVNGSVFTLYGEL